MTFQIAHRAYQFANMTALHLRDSPADILRRPSKTSPGQEMLCFGGDPFRSRMSVL